MLSRMQGAISYECRTELDFDNELKGDRREQQCGCGPQITGVA